MPPRVSNRSESSSRATAAANATVTTTPPRKAASDATAERRCDQPALTCRSQGFNPRPTRAVAAMPARGRLAITQPPKLLPPWPSSQPPMSPPNRNRSAAGATARETITPAGNAPNATAASRQPACRARQPDGSNCQRWAASSSTTGTTKKPVTSGISARSISGANTSPAMKPSTTLGRLAIISMVGLMRDFHRGCMNWLA